MRSAYDPIRIEHLLTHSAGLIRGADMTADSRFDVWALRDTETGFAPGEHFYYSNVGYRTLGYALEAATGKRYRDLLTSRILEPLGLEQTEPEITVEIRERMAVGYDRLHDDRTPSPDDPLYPGSRGSRRGRPTARSPPRPAIWRRSARICSTGPAEDSSPRADCSTPATGGATATGSSARASLVRPRRLDARLRLDVARRSRVGYAVGALMNGPDEHDATEVVAQFALDLHRGAKPEPPGDSEP